MRLATGVAGVVVVSCCCVSADVDCEEGSDSFCDCCCFFFCSCRFWDCAFLFSAEGRCEGKEYFVVILCFALAFFFIFSASFHCLPGINNIHYPDTPAVIKLIVPGMSGE